jgi:hypothetical protein
MAATSMEMAMAGPAFWAAATPVRENSPAPMIAPIPKAMRFPGPSVRFSLTSAPSDSAMMLLTDLVANRLMAPPSFSR